MGRHNRKNIRQLQKELVTNLSLDFFEDDEIALILQDIKSYDKGMRQIILALCVTLSGASSSFVPSALTRIRRASGNLPLKDLQRWLVHAFDLLDASGTGAFVTFTSRVDKETLMDFRHPDGLHLKTVATVLESFIRGISGMELRIVPGKYSYTDTSSIFLPAFINRFEDNAKNFLIYKISAVYKWAQIVHGTVTPDEALLRTFMPGEKEKHPDIGTFFRLFSNRKLAQDIYNILEAIRLDAFLQSEVPGLMREATVLKLELFENRLPLQLYSDEVTLVEGLYQYYLNGAVQGELAGVLKMVMDKLPELKQAAGPGESMNTLLQCRPDSLEIDSGYVLPGVSLLLGRIEPEKVSRKLKEKRRKKKKHIESIISKMISMPDFVPVSKPHAHGEDDDRKVDPQKEYLMIKGKLIEMDDDTSEVINEKGGIPGGVLVKGSEAGGGCPMTITDLTDEEETLSDGEHSGGIKYDEWDFRRGGYKRRWCSLYEHDIHPGNDPFVESTLKRYSGYVSVLRKRFELLNREPRLLRRQKEGNHVDIDATIEAFTDMQAGISPGENLFMRLDRHDRNIAVLFLLDMSGSTKGWVNQAEKEALVMMCEALETLSDRYAIYGFSGHTRTRCDYYRIKSFEDFYGDTVKSRISGITPKDYTRMGPPIRHSLNILNSVEARTKLLIILSDGKPEDWDNYKGEYGIEDTRKALIESREQGVHPFCITIDEEASTYLPHLYGEAKYIFIDDVKKLPNRITEIYRMLTT
ncbi:MAG: VWA domain-containing protein [Nitrospira sp.]|nr:VWA domain-containing protein [bacterium]MBL7049205.1 VWA domain-containing protein [Nitrospira sp.]